MTQPTPDPGAGGRGAGRPPRTTAQVAAGVVCILHALVLVALSGFYAVELVRGEGSSTATVAMSAVLILVFAVLLVVLGRAWFAGSSRAAVPTFVWNGLLVPVVVALYGGEQALLATALLVLVVAGVLTAIAALLSPGTR